MTGAAAYGVRLVREGQVDYGQVDGPTDVVRVARAALEDLARESFLAIALDTKGRVLGVHEVSRGLLDASLVGAREVFQFAILANASRIALAHNHPSGNPAPSPDDVRVTDRLAEAGRLLGIPVVDHVIVGHGRWTSLAETGALR